MSFKVLFKIGQLVLVLLVLLTIPSSSMLMQRFPDWRVSRDWCELMDSDADRRHLPFPYNLPYLDDFLADMTEDEVRGCGELRLAFPWLRARSHTASLSPLHSHTQGWVRGAASATPWLAAVPQSPAQ